MALITPIADYKVTSEFGPRVIAGEPSFHRGRDFAPDHWGRARVRATRKCRFESITRDRKPGDTSTVNSIRPGITGNGPKLANPFDPKFGTEAVGHVDVDDNFKVGDWLLPGQEYGWTDLSGNTDGYHVHYEIHPATAPANITRYTAVDPAPYFEGDDMALDAADKKWITSQFENFVGVIEDPATGNIMMKEGVRRNLILGRESRGKLNLIMDKLDTLGSSSPGAGATVQEIKDLLNSTVLGVK